MAGKSARRDERLSATVVGAGIAGMTAALRLLDAGFEVTVIEKTGDVGGKFGAINVGGTYHEHAYHFLADWCVNFWDVVESIGLSKSEHFVRRDAIKFLRFKPEKRRTRWRYDFTELKHGSAVLNFWDNVYSGVIPPDDMIAYAYSLLDLVTETSDDEDPDELEFLNRTSVNGFMRSLPYMTDLAALLHQEALLKAFAVPSYETSVRSYQTFIRFFGRDDGGWILKGDCHRKFWEPFLRKLQSYTGVHGRPRFRLCRNTSVKEIEVEPAEAERCPRVRAVRVEGPDCEPRMPVNHLILAAPYFEVARLVEQHPLLRSSLSDLLGLRKLRSRQMASLDLYFGHRLPGIPEDHVTLLDDSRFAGIPRPPRRLPLIKGETARRERLAVLSNRGDIASRYGLSFIDNYQAWNDMKPPQETWLNVVSADFEELAGLDPSEAEEVIIGELSRYLDFNDKDIDRDRSYFRLNDDAPLFMNSVGSWQFRPETRTDKSEYRDLLVHRRVEHLYLAGDYCRSKIDLVCLEGAVTTGIAAAVAAAKDCGLHDRVKEPAVAPQVSSLESERAKVDLRPWLALAAKSRAGTSS